MDVVKPPSLKNNFCWTLAGNVIYAGCQWGILVALAKIGSPEMVGQFALGLAITAPVFMLTNLQLRGIQATDVKREFPFQSYFRIRVISTIIALIIIAGIIATVGYRWETAAIVMMVGIAKAVESISDIMFGAMQLHEKMDKIAQSMICKGVLSVATFSGAVYVTGSTLIGVSALTISWLLTLIVYDLRHTSKLVRSPLTVSSRQKNSDLVSYAVRRAPLRGLLIISLPMGLVMMLISFNSNLPRYFIDYFLGERELGIFSAIAYLLIAGITVVGALGQSATPRLAKLYSVCDYNGFRQLVFRLCAIGLMLGIFGVLAAVFLGREILTLVYRSEYATHADLFILVMIAACIAFISSFLGYSITAARQFKVQVPLFVVVTVVTLAACYRFIGSQGLNGAGMALIISGGVQLFGSSIIMWRILKSLNGVYSKGQSND